jgi:hypothetical protein
MLADAWVEWRPAGGGPLRSQILDASLHGISFGLEPGTEPPAEGTELEAVVISVGRTTIRGRLVVIQWTESIARGGACGAEFHPASFDDAQRYRGVIAALEESSRLRAAAQNE